MKIDDRGRLTFFDVQTSGGDLENNAFATGIMNSWISGEAKAMPDKDEEEKTPRNINSRAAALEMVEEQRGNKGNAKIKAAEMVREGAKELGLAMLDHHDDEHGDVEEFKHHIVSGAGFGAGYDILSPDADKAALEEMNVLTQEIGTVLGDFFGKTMGIENPFALIFGNDGLLSFNADSLPTLESKAVQKVLVSINKYLTADAAGEETEGMLNPMLTGIAEKFAALEEVMGKLHDKSLVPTGGVRFGVNLNSH